MGRGVLLSPREADEAQARFEALEAEVEALRARLEEVEDQRDTAYATGANDTSEGMREELEAMRADKALLDELLAQALERVR